MPIYEYQCPRCERKFERLQKMDDPVSIPCPDCGAGSERLPSAGAAIISRAGKGEGVGPEMRCDRVSPCCGREVHCGTRPCDG